MLVRNNRNTTDGFITDAMLDDWIREAHQWATAYKKWPLTEGRASTTYASLVTDEDGELRGEYFEGWKTDSIRWLWIGRKRLTKTAFQQYKRMREETPGSTDKVFTDYGRLYYVNPNADVSGTITAWGQYTPTLDTTDKAATTVFSNNEESGNEAIVEKMTGYLKRREHLPQEAVQHEQIAALKLDMVWQKFEDEQYGYHSGDTGMWEYVDVLSGGMKDDLVKRDRWY